jgi:putative peptidoglycan lipid II flippase
MPRFSLSWRGLREAWAHEGVHHVLLKMAPALLGVSVAQISQLINTQIASQLGAGAVSLLTYADRLMEFPTALLGVALGVVLTPQLSAAHARKDEAGYSGLLEWGLRQLLLVALPCAMALLVFAEPLVATLYQRGAFAADPANVRGAGLAVVGYGVGLLGIVSIRILAPGYYARQDMRTPVRVAVGVLVLTQLFNLVFVFGLGMGIAGLALSTSLGALVNAGTLLFVLWRRGSWRPGPGWIRYLMQLVAASAAMGAGLSWLNDRLDWAHMAELARIGWMAASLTAAALVYFGTLLLAGLKPKQLLRRA